MKNLILAFCLLLAVTVEAGLLDLFGLFSWNDKESKEYIQKNHVIIQAVRFNKGVMMKGGKVIVNQATVDKLVKKDASNRKAATIIKDYNLVVK